MAVHEVSPQCGSRQKVQFARSCQCLHAIGDAKLAKDMVVVHLHRTDDDIQPVGNLLVGHAGRHQAQNLELAVGQGFNQRRRDCDGRGACAACVQAVCWVSCASLSRSRAATAKGSPPASPSACTARPQPGVLRRTAEILLCPLLHRPIAGRVLCDKRPCSGGQGQFACRRQQFADGGELQEQQRQRADRNGKLKSRAEIAACLRLGRLAPGRCRPTRSAPAPGRRDR